MTTRRRAAKTPRLVATAFSAWLALSFAPASMAAQLATATAQGGAGQPEYTADATVEAVRDSRVAAQVAGRITEINVRAGDRVQAGQTLMRIDPSMAAQQVAGSQAQVAQAQALLAAARADFERTQQLQAKNYVSKAALDHAQAQYDAAQAQARALTAQAAVASVQAGYYVVKAPYDGWVAQVPVSVGDMAAPGVLLASVYDPRALRVATALPESVAAQLDRDAPAVVELVNLPADVPANARRQTVAHVTVLPALDAATHSATVRVDLPAQPAGVLPGQFARVRFALKPGDKTSTANQDGAAAVNPRRVRVPRSAVVQRGELSAVYVVNAQGQAQLRQIRLGRSDGEQIEVLAGLSVGEKVALDPVAAAQGGGR
jgi:RND family efflux transporter MFP subunit